MLFAAALIFALVACCSGQLSEWPQSPGSAGGFGQWSPFGGPGPGFGAPPNMYPRAGYDPSGPDVSGLGAGGQQSRMPFARPPPGPIDMCMQIMLPDRRKNETLPSSKVCNETFRLDDLCPGDMDRLHLRWYYDASTNSCEPFIGCKPKTEGNNFQFIDTCASVCNANMSMDDMPPPPPSGGGFPPSMGSQFGGGQPMMGQPPNYGQSPFGAAGGGGRQTRYGQMMMPPMGPMRGGFGGGGFMGGPPMYDAQSDYGSSKNGMQ